MIVGPIIFLDIDGVLNCKTTVDRIRGCYGIDPEKVALLNKILRFTGAKVVISSTWRILWRMDNLLAVLQSRGFEGGIIGKTPRRLSGFRANEIDAWMETNNYHGPFLILDDDADAHAHHPQWGIRTSFEEGLTQAHVDRAFEMFEAYLMMD